MDASTKRKLLESINLQDAKRLINSDLHWNPVKLMQRIGRVDRRMNPDIEQALSAQYPTLANVRSSVIYWNFLSPDELNSLLRLCKRVSEKKLVLKCWMEIV